MVHTCISYSASIRFVAVYSSTQSSCSSKINGTDSSEQIRSCPTGRVVNWRTAFTWRWRQRCFMWSASVKSFFSTCAVRSVAYCKTPILPMRLSRVIVDGRFCLWKIKPGSLLLPLWYFHLYSEVCTSYPRSKRMPMLSSKNSSRAVSASQTNYSVDLERI